MIERSGLERVLDEREFIRRVAREWLLDGADLDDLEQEVYARTLRVPPAASQPARPWLRVVIRRLVIDRWRRESTRQLAEGQVVRSEEPALYTQHGDRVWSLCAGPSSVRAQTCVES